MRRCSWVLELLAGSTPDAAREVLAGAGPVLVARLAVAAAAVTAAAAEGGLQCPQAGGVLLEADQLAAVVGSVAGGLRAKKGLRMYYPQHGGSGP